MNYIYNLYFYPDYDLFVIGDLHSGYLSCDSEHPGYRFCEAFRKSSTEAEEFEFEGDFIIRYGVSESRLEILRDFIRSYNSLCFEVNKHGLL